MILVAFSILPSQNLRTAFCLFPKKKNYQKVKLFFNLNIREEKNLVYNVNQVKIIYHKI